MDILAHVPPPPRQPSAQARRLLFRYQLGERFGLALGALLLLIGLGLNLVSNGSLPRDLELDVRGSPAPTEGEITGVSTTSFRINRRPVRAMHFRYVVDGTTYQGESTTLDRDFADRPVGSKVRVELVPSSPSRSRIVGTTVNPTGHLTMPLVLLVLLGGLIPWFIRKGKRRQIQAFTLGRVERGTITFHGPDPTTHVNGHHPTKLEWTFEINGRPYTGSVSSMDPDEIAAVARQEPLAVLYDPFNPSYNAIWIE